MSTTKLNIYILDPNYHTMLVDVLKHSLDQAPLHFLDHSNWLSLRKIQLILTIHIHFHYLDGHY